MRIAQEESVRVGVVEACRALGLSRATYYRKLAEEPLSGRKRERRSARRLSVREEQQILTYLTSERFMDLSVPEVHATLLDEGVYICSVRTMYRVLAKHRAVRERRDQKRHPRYEKPELLATDPNQVWSWDITKLKGPRKWSHYHLYVILDIYSRYVVGWMVAERESAVLGRRLIEETCERQSIREKQLTIHADRGAPMRSKAVSQLMAELGITKTHSRPYVSDDNPYSESQFKTLKYNSGFPGQFGSLEDARIFLRQFFQWYNDEHRHSGIAMMTPRDVHTGKAEDITRKRQETMNAAYDRHPERFVSGQPKLKPLTREVWINKPAA